MKNASPPRLFWIFLAMTIAGVLFLTACAGPPQALMTASVTTGQAPLSVSFANKSKHADEVRWDFGDGATATTTKEKKTTHEYTKAGAHAVTLTAVKKGEPPQTSTASINITVEPGPLDRVKIDLPVATVEVAKEVKLAATAVDRFDNPIPGLRYTFSSQEKAGKVDQEGKFTAGTSAGSYESGLTVEVVQGSATRAASAKVTVKPGPLDHVSIEPGAATLEVGKEQKFTATALDQFDNPMPGLSYAFRSDEKAGKVDNEGKFTAGAKAGSYQNSVIVEVAQGSATKTATARITVKPGPLDRVKIDPEATTVEVGREQQFTATALDRFGNPIPGLSYTLRSDEKAGKVDSAGKFTAATRPGSYENGLTVEVAQSTATRTATARLTLRHGPLDRVLLSPTTATLDIDGTQEFKAEAADSYGNPIPEAKITWQVAGQVGTIDDRGLLTVGTKAGTFGQGVKAATTIGGVSKAGTATVSVRPGPLVGILVAPGEVRLPIGGKEPFTIQGADRYGNTVPLAVGEATWLLLKEAGSLDAKGLLTAGKAAGSYKDAVQARAVLGATAHTATASVTILPDPLDRVEVLPKSAVFGISMPQQFVAVARDQFGNSLSDVVFTWSAREGGILDEKQLLTAGEKPGAYQDTVKVVARQGDRTRS